MLSPWAVLPRSRVDVWSGGLSTLEDGWPPDVPRAEEPRPLPRPGHHPGPAVHRHQWQRDCVPPPARPLWEPPPDASGVPLHGVVPPDEIVKGYEYAAAFAHDLIRSNAFSRIRDAVGRNGVSSRVWRARARCVGRAPQCLCRADDHGRGRSPCYRPRRVEGDPSGAVPAGGCPQSRAHSGPSGAYSGPRAVRPDRLPQGADWTAPGCRITPGCLRARGVPTILGSGCWHPPGCPRGGPMNIREGVPI